MIEHQRLVLTLWMQGGGFDLTGADDPRPIKPRDHRTLPDYGMSLPRCWQPTEAGLREVWARVRQGFVGLEITLSDVDKIDVDDERVEFHFTATRTTA